MTTVKHKCHSAIFSPTRCGRPPPNNFTNPFTTYRLLETYSRPIPHHLTNETRRNTSNQTSTMSTLPPAPKDVSEHPAKGAVTEPIDREKLQSDVARKLRLYGAVQAMGESRLPTNEQLDRMLASLSSSTLAHADALSPDGQHLARDAHDVCETLRRLVAQKNADELLQNFVWDTRDASLDRARGRTGTDTGAGKVEVPAVEHERERTDGDEARRHLRTLLSLVFTNAEVRKLASDMGVVGRDLLARGAEKVAAAARPTEEQLSTVDQPGPEHRFVTEEGREVGSGETPVRLFRCVCSVVSNH